jgi:hypothetical protein
MTQGAVRSDYLDWLAEALSPSRPRLGIDIAGDVVLGYATGYGPADIAPFVHSLRAAFNGPVALVVDETPAVLAFLREHDVIAIPPRRWTGWAPHPVMLRFDAFDRLLEQWPGVTNVLITDVRDVVFQASPFVPTPQPLEAFIEAETPLGNHAFNMKHLRALAGDGLATALSDRPCLCIGTVIGARSEVRRLCRLILSLAATPRSAIGGTFGADQAAFNLAIHQELIPATVRPNYGRVATLGMTDGDGLVFRDGQVINPDGSVSPIVHQHDRHPHLDVPVHARWSGGLEHRPRIQPRSAGDRLTKLKSSLRRRMPELR